MALLERLGGKSSALQFQKLLFLASERQGSRSYSFVPYKFGCFSFESYADRRALEGKGVLEDSQTWILTEPTDYYDSLNDDDREAIDDVVREFRYVKKHDLLKHIYLNYPFYAQRSEILDEVLKPFEQKKVAEGVENSRKVFTLGYEGLSIDQYLSKLIGNNVKALCDVRRNPLSRKFGFSKNQLKEHLNRVGISYVHIPELGIASEERRELNTFQDYKALFSRYRKTTLRREGSALDYLLDLEADYRRIALTCYEADVEYCHRGCVSSALERHKRWDAELEHL